MPPATGWVPIIYAAMQIPHVLSSVPLEDLTLQTRSRLSFFAALPSCSHRPIAHNALPPHQQYNVVARAVLLVLAVLAVLLLLTLVAAPAVLLLLVVLVKDLPKAANGFGTQRSRQKPLCPTLTATPFPKVQDLFSLTYHAPSGQVWPSFLHSYACAPMIAYFYGDTGCPAKWFHGRWLGVTTIWSAWP